MKQNMISKAFLLPALLLLTGLAQAETKTPARSSSYNATELAIGAVALLLVFVIWGLGRVLVVMGKRSLERTKINAAIFSVISFLGLCLLSSPASAETKLAVTGGNIYGMNETSFYTMLSVIFIELAVIMTILFFIRRLRTGGNS